MKTPSAADSCIHVTLKEFVESLLEAQDKVVDGKFAAMALALDLQAKEYSRRLSELNHAHEANIARNAEFIGKEKFESFEREFRQYKEANDKAVDAKAKSIAEAVEQKASSDTEAVDAKANAIKKEFDEYKTTQATAVALAAGKQSIIDPQLTEFIQEMKNFRQNQISAGERAAGGTQKMSAIKAAIIAAIGVSASLVWALSLTLGIYLALHGSK